MRRLTTMNEQRKNQKKANLSMELTNRKAEHMIIPTVFGLKLRNSSSVEKKNISPPKVVVQKGYKRLPVKAKIVSSIPKPKFPPKPQKPDINDRMRYNIDGWQHENPSFNEFDEVCLSPKNS